MPLTAAQRREAAAAAKAAEQRRLMAALEAAVAAGVRKEAAAGVRHLVTWLPLPGGGRVKLAERDGTATAFGERYHALTGELDNWDRGQGPSEGSRGTYATHRALGRVLVQQKARRPSDGQVELRPTELGKSFFRNHAFEYQVQIPVGEHYPRANGTYASYEGSRELAYVAVTDTVLQAHDGRGLLRTVGLVKPGAGLATEAERERHIKEAVMSWISSCPTWSPPGDPFEGLDENRPPPRRPARHAEYRVLWSNSQKVYTYDPSRPLLLSAIVRDGYDLRPSGADVILDRPLRGVPIVPDDFYARFGVTPLAFEEQPADGLGCVAVQLAALFRGRAGRGGERWEPLFDLANVEAELDRVFDELGYRVGAAPYDGLSPEERARCGGRAWRVLGVTAKMVLKFCERHGASCWILHGRDCIYKFDPPGHAQRHRPIVAFNIWGDHAFLYESTEAIRGIAQMTAQQPAAPSRKRLVGLLADEGSDDEPPTKRYRAAPESWELYVPDEPEQQDAPPLRVRLDGTGRDWVISEDLARDREELRQRGIPFTPVLGATPEELRSLVVHRTGRRRDDLIIRGVPEDHRALASFCDHLSEVSGFCVGYRGERLATMAHRAIQALLAGRRLRTTPELRGQLLERQRGLCARCADELDEEAEVDHVRPLQCGGGNDVSNLQVLCRPCHREKTSAERQPLDRQVRLQSQLSLELVRLFHQAPKPRQLVFGRGPPEALPSLRPPGCGLDFCPERCGCRWCEEDLRRRRTRPAPADVRVHCLDAVGCRRNALLKCPRGLPVFCALDEIEVLPPGADVGGYDFLYVDSPAPRPRPNGRVLPYSGARWYWVEAAEYLLARRIVQRREVTHGLRASGHVDPAALASAVASLEAAWRLQCQEEAAWAPGSYKDRKGWAGAEAASRTKSCSLAAIGLWNQVRSSRWTATVSTEQGDAPGGAADLKRLLVGEDGQVRFEFLLETELVGNRSMRPLGQVALDVEQLRVAQALELVEASPHCTLLRAVKVDGLHFEGDGEALAAAAATALTFADGGPAFGLKVPRSLEAMDREDSLLPGNAQADWPEPLQLERLGGWRRHLVEDVADEAWRGRLVAEVVANGGAFLRGVAGVGKSTVLGALIAHLREVTGDGEGAAQQVFVAAFQHSSARLVGGETLLRLLHRVGGKQDRWLILDEVSQVPVACLGDVAALRLVGWKVVLAGDWEGQLPPVVDRWGDARACRDMANSRLAMEIANGLRVDLTKNCRCREHPEHFAWCTSLYGQGPRLRELVEDAARRFPLTGSWPDHVLCTSHEDRLAMNALLNERAAEGREGRALLLAADAGGGDRHMTLVAQNAWVWPGLVLIGCGGGRGEVVNAVVYRVRSVAVELVDDLPRVKSLVVAVDAEMRREGDADIELTAPKAALLLRPAHAMTYHAAQGRTLRDRRVMLLGTRSRTFTLGHLIVGGSRVTAGHLLGVPQEAREVGWRQEGLAALARMARLG